MASGASVPGIKYPSVARWTLALWPLASRSIWMRTVSFGTHGLPTAAWPQCPHGRAKRSRRCSVSGGAKRRSVRFCHCYSCLLYTSDAADEEDSVDLGGRRIITEKDK